MQFGIAAIPDGRGQAQNWIDFHIAVTGSAGPISSFTRRQNSEAVVRGRESVFDLGGQHCRETPSLRMGLQFASNLPRLW
jgi:hypothetical protein